MQSRFWSAVEATANTASGFAISVAAGLVIYPAYGFKPSLGDAVSLTAIFTVISVLRSYAWRRLFNRWTGNT